MPWAPKPPCRTPGCPHLQPCPTHPARPRPPRPPGATTRGGWGTAHQQARARLAPLVATGTLRCCRCGRLIAPGEKWDLDHTGENRQGYAPAHAHCNRSAGGRLGAARRWRSR